MNSLFTWTLCICAMTVGVGSAHASYVTYFGKDQNGSNTVPLATTPNATAAQTLFLSGLVNPQVETFEGIAAGAANPTLSFGSRTAALSGGSNSSVMAFAPGATDGFGRYSVPAGSSKFYGVEANATNSTFSVTFSEEVAAFGFFGIDIGDVGGSLSLDLYNDQSQLIQAINVPGSQSPLNDGSVLYFGLTAGSADEFFKTVTFRNFVGSGDGFAFDNFTVADPSQVSVVPEPGSLALLGLGLAGLVALRRRNT